MTDLAVVSAPIAEVRALPDASSELTDELLHGFECRVLSRSRGWVRVRSHYGYEGYVAIDALKLVTEPPHGASPFVVNTAFLDVLSRPDIRSARLACLSRGAIVSALPDRIGTGWKKLFLADGHAGFVPERHLTERRFSDTYRDFSFSALLERCYGGNEEAFRMQLTREAKSFLGTQYRWGGRSSGGVDCSGLVSLSYMLAGVNIFRDARIEPGFPIRELHDAPREGDLLYFPGHVAMYLGDGRYIHATAHPGANGVVTNSLRPEAPDFRRDLARSLCAVGGLRR